VLVEGGLVAFPTETVYGLGARADRAEAVRRIFEAKGRPSGNPLIVHVADRAAARALAAEWPDVAEALAEAFWPGPLTIVVKRAEGVVADEVTAGGATVGIRVPAHPAALALLAEARVPVAAPSANRSTTISPTTADHVQKTLDGRVDVVLDAGPTGFGIESTIVDVTRAPMRRGPLGDGVPTLRGPLGDGVPTLRGPLGDGVPTLRLLRHGAIAMGALAKFGAIEDATIAAVGSHERADAPGMHAKHYAPRAKAILAGPAEVRAIVEAHRASGAKTGAIEIGEATVSGLVEVLAPEPHECARELYAALHRLDDAGCDVIVIARAPEDDAWAAIRDRLRRATAP